MVHRPATRMTRDSYTSTPELENLPEVAQRFLRYVRIDTTADPDSATVPSSSGQLELARLLVSELEAIGLDDVEMDVHGYVYATVPASEEISAPPVALLAHLDTSPDAPGENVIPQIHRDYDGGVIYLCRDRAKKLDPAERPALLDHIGHDIITSDGTTLLGSDDKAGVAIIMQLMADLVVAPFPHPPIRICFTVDEELGRGVDHINLERLDAAVAYTIDGSGRDVLYCETFNAAEAIVRIEGRTVHPGYAAGKMVNALRITADFIAALPRDQAPETTSEREGYIHPHQIREGRVDDAELLLLLRDFSEEGLEAKKSFILEIAKRVEAEYPGSVVEVEILDRYRNMRKYIDEVDPRARTFALEAAREAGTLLVELPVRGGTDGAKLSELGLPTPNIFNGGHDYHSVLEWNSVQNLEHSLAYLKTLLTFWAHHGSQTADTHG